MIIVKAVCTPRPGCASEAEAAARELTERANTHPGVLAYFWSRDERTGHLIDHEVHKDESALLNHIAVSDLTRMHGAMTIASVELFGDSPSAQLQEMLSRFGQYRHYPGV